MTREHSVIVRLLCINTPRTAIYKMSTMKFVLCLNVCGSERLSKFIFNVIYLVKQISGKELVFLQAIGKYLRFNVCGMEFENTNRDASD